MDIKIIHVNKNDEDAKLIMEWRNDKDTLQNSFNQSPYNWNDFQTIFYNKYFENQLCPLFATYNNEKIAFIGSMDTSDKKTIDISININPKYRNKGIGGEIVNSLHRYCQDWDSWWAQSDSWNKSAQKMFLNSNYNVKI